MQLNLNFFKTVTDMNKIILNDSIIKGKKDDHC